MNDVWVSGLIALSTALIMLVLRIGYKHAMRRFDKIDEDETRNQTEHTEIKERLVRVETLVINGGRH